MKAGHKKAATDSGKSMAQENTQPNQIYPKTDQMSRQNLRGQCIRAGPPANGGLLPPPSFGNRGTSYRAVRLMKTISGKAVEMKKVNRTATGEPFIEHDVIADGAAALLDVCEVARLLNCSVRHVYRLADGGRMPRPLKLGSTLNRWQRAAIEGWIADGCRPCQRGRGV